MFSLKNLTHLHNTNKSQKKHNEGSCKEIIIFADD